MYTKQQLFNDVDRLCHMGASCGNIGVTEMGRTIPYVFLGKRKPPYMVVVGSTHAREHVTSKLIVEQIFSYIKHRVTLNGGIYFVPMLNIDGVDLCQNGILSLPQERQEFLLKTNGGSQDFSLWKANINGVDLNTNFDARWGQGSQNLFFPSPFNYVGRHPFCQSESRAISSFVQKTKANMVLTYHSKGEIIFWKFFQQKNRAWRDYRYAKFVSMHTGYPLVEAKNSTGGLKDWCIDKLHIPSLTIEVGHDDLDYSQHYDSFDEIFRQNGAVPQRLLNTMARDMERRRKSFTAPKER